MKKANTQFELIPGKLQKWICFHFDSITMDKMCCVSFTSPLLCSIKAKLTDFIFAQSIFCDKMKMGELY